MKAIVIATALGHDAHSAHDPRSNPMLPLVDRPFLQHVVESLVDAGVTEFDFVLSQDPEIVEQLLGYGSRWGSIFRFHLVKDQDRPYAAIRGMNHRDADGTIVIAHADRLPPVGTLPVHAPGVVTLCSRDEAGSGDDARSLWTGWALVSSAFLRTVPADATEREFGECLLAASHGVMLETDPPLSVQTYADLLQSQQSVLEKAHGGLLLSGREVDKNVWISRNVALHPTARIVPPVFIGENCRIGANTQIGPNAVIGEGCVLDKCTVVTNATILKGSFVGEGLELCDVVVDRNRLVHARIGVAVSITDNFLLSDMSDGHVSTFFRDALSRVLGAFLFVLALPLLLVTALYIALKRNGPALVHAPVLRLPAAQELARWRVFQLVSFMPWTASAGADGAWEHLLFRVLPGLVNVMRGEMRLVGVPPRSAESVESLPVDWQTLYRNAKSGLITEASVYCGPSPDEDDLYAAEAFYSVKRGLRHDVRLVLGFVGRLIAPGESARYRATSTVPLH